MVVFLLIIALDIAPSHTKIVSSDKKSKETKLQAESLVSQKLMNQVREQIMLLLHLRIAKLRNQLYALNL